eukprot:2905275-Pyramimonas_sp.AAC.1
MTSSGRSFALGSTACRIIARACTSLARSRARRSTHSRSRRPLRVCSNNKKQGGEEEQTTTEEEKRRK